MLRKKPSFEVGGLLRTAGGPSGPPKMEGADVSCTSIGTSSSPADCQSSVYFQRFPGGSKDGLRSVLLVRVLLLPATLCSPIGGSPFAPLISSKPPPLLHSALVPASKKPEHWLKMSRCSRYRCSRRPLALVSTISTSPVSENTGNSFCGAYPFWLPWWVRACRCRLVADRAEATEDARCVEGGGGGCGASA